MKERWIDVAIVVIPMLEFVTKWMDLAPLARLLRLGRLCRRSNSPACSGSTGCKGWRPKPGTPC